MSRKKLKKAAVFPGYFILAYHEITLPPAALPGAKLLKKFDQNFC